MKDNEKSKKILIDFEQSFKVKGLGSLSIREIDSLFDEHEFAAYANVIEDAPNDKSVNEM
jgi:hypothetical protein